MAIDKNYLDKSAAVPAAIVIHTTARVQGVQTGHVSVNFARTQQAVVTLMWGGILLRFVSAEAAQGVLEGFAAARAALSRLDNNVAAQAPAQGCVEFASQTMELTWTRRATYAVVPQSRYSERLRRTVHWVDLHMGPVTWQIIDHVGFQSAIDILRTAHKTAVGVCLDGGKFRSDPTRSDYQRGE